MSNSAEHPVDPHASAASGASMYVLRRCSSLAHILTMTLQKCDGGRPVCGPCIRSRRETECEYLDGPRPSRKQVLEEQIARLQERVQELEAAGRGSTPITASDSPVSPPTSPCQYSVAHATLPSLKPRSLRKLSLTFTATEGQQDCRIVKCIHTPVVGPSVSTAQYNGRPGPGSGAHDVRPST